MDMSGNGVAFCNDLSGLLDSGWIEQAALPAVQIRGHRDGNMYHAACMSSFSDIFRAIRSCTRGWETSRNSAPFLASGFCVGSCTDWHGFRSVCCAP